MKNHHLDLVRVTESGAIAAAAWVGKGDKIEADKAATDAMRKRLNSIDFSAEIAIGEGIKDESFGLYQGEIVGDSPQSVQQYSIALDPIEGTTPVAFGGYEAMSVIAMANYDCFLKTDAFYMNKFAVGPEVVKYLNGQTESIGIKNDIKTNVELLSKALNKPIGRITVCVLNRPRHSVIIEQLRGLQCRIKFITDCDVTACIATCDPDSGIDMYIGVGGAPESVISAAAMKCMGGFFEAQIASNEGLMLPSEKIYSIEELAKGDVMFCATGITDGQLLKGVQFNAKGPVTHSIAMRSESKTVRRIITEHGN